jgi:hypothetical protein
MASVIIKTVVSRFMGKSLEQEPNKSAINIVTLPKRNISATKVDKMQKIEDNIRRIQSELQQSETQLSFKIPNIRRDRSGLPNRTAHLRREPSSAIIRATRKSSQRHRMALDRTLTN